MLLKIKRFNFLMPTKVLTFSSDNRKERVYSGSFFQ
jgi:hypothetical protein